MNGSRRLAEDEWYWEILQCPNCYGPLTRGTEFSCQACQLGDGKWSDLRLRLSRDVNIAFGSLPHVHPAKLLESIDTTPPALTYRGPHALRDSVELMSEVSARLPNGGRVLDLGCGPRDQAAPLEFLGFAYLGIDYTNESADLLADAHALPVKSSCLDCVFYYAVLEHLHNPFLAIQEIMRVLKPGGWFIGTVSQGEPFHSSYFHFTPWGLFSLVGSAPGLKIIRMWPATDTLNSLATMGRYSRMLRWMLHVLDFLNRRCPWLTPRKMRWPVKERQIDRLFRAGSICYAIQKCH